MHNNNYQKCISDIELALQQRLVSRACYLAKRAEANYVGRGGKISGPYLPILKRYVAAMACVNELYYETYKSELPLELIRRYAYSQLPFNRLIQELKEGNCSICLDPVLLGEYKRCPGKQCYAYSHTACLSEWLVPSRPVHGCPACRAPCKVIIKQPAVAAVTPRAVSEYYHDAFMPLPLDAVRPAERTDQNIYTTLNTGQGYYGW